MGTTSRIAAAEWETLRITPDTVWSFLRLTADDGRTGVGEATLPKAHLAVAEAAEIWLPAVIGLAVDNVRAIHLRSEETGLAPAALRSALDMALLDLEGQARGQPVHVLLGEVMRRRVPLYANINRRTKSRLPEAFAESATSALGQGYTAVKLAPFDEVTPERCAREDVDALLRLGLARIEATRAAIGSEASLRIDCHWRFDHAAAIRMIDACSAFAPDWIECPIPEAVAAADGIAELRRQANRLGIRLAGLEMGTCPEAFMPFLAVGAYDVIMPDVKYLGGLRRFADLAEEAERHGALLSPHNPTGPVCHAASLHVATALPALDSLEIQFDETPIFQSLVGGPVTAIDDGHADMPTAPGLGVSLDPGLIETLRLHPSSNDISE